MNVKSLRVFLEDSSNFHLYGNFQGLEVLYLELPSIGHPKCLKNLELPTSLQHLIICYRKHDLLSRLSKANFYDDKKRQLYTDSFAQECIKHIRFPFNCDVLVDMDKAKCDGVYFDLIRTIPEKEKWDCEPACKSLLNNLNV
jgi:hypothetical protein